MFVFTKKTKQDTINSISEVMKEYKEEMKDCILPEDALPVFYLGGCKSLDNLYKKESDNFNLHNLFNYKKISLADCLKEHKKIRKSFFYSLNNIKQNENLFYDDALLDFLKRKGNLFLSNYLKGFQKAAELYAKKLKKDKLPEYRQFFMWKDATTLYFLDNLFVYLDPLKLNIDNIVSYYKDEDLAKTILEYTENEESKTLEFNLASFDNLRTTIPFKTSY